MCEAHWGIAYHTNSNSPRARKWYYVARLIEADGKWWCIGRHSTVSSNSRKIMREQGLNAGLALLHGVYADAPSPRNGPEMIRTF